MKQKITFFKVLLTLVLLCGVGNAWGETKKEGFEKAATGTDYQSTVTVESTNSDCGIGWEIYYGTVSTANKITGNNSAALRLYTSDNYGYIMTTTPIEGLTKVSFNVKAQTSNSAKILYDVFCSADKETWTIIGSKIAPGTTAENKSYDVTKGSKYIKIEINSNSKKPTKSNAQLTIDDVEFTYTAPQTDPFVVTFDAGTNGTCSTSSLTEASAGAGITLPSCTAKDGYVFKGWSTTENGTTADAGMAGATYKPSSDCTLYAVYNKLYMVTIVTPENGTLVVKKGDTPVQSGSSFEDGTTFTVEATPNVGYKFRNWQAVDNTTHTYTKSNTGDYILDGNDLTFKANFDELSKYTINYMVNGVNTNAQENVYEGTALVFPTVANIAGMIFKGWVDAAIIGKETNAPSYINNLNLTASSDKTYYAVFADQEGTEDFVKVITAPEDWSGDYLVVYEAGNVAFNAGLATLDATNNYISVTINNGMISLEESLNQATVNIQSTNGGYTIQAKNGKYIGNTKQKNSAADNGFTTSDEMSIAAGYLANISLDADGNALISVNYNGQTTFKFNNTSDQNRFRFYKSGQQPVALYKKTETLIRGYYTTLPVNVDITSAGYATAYIPFNSTVEGATAYYVTIDGNKAQLNEIEGTIPAETGVVLKGAEGTATFTESAVEPTTDVSANKMVGTLTGATFSDKNFVYYRLANNGSVGFYKQNADGSAECAAGKAVLAVPASAVAPTSFTFDDATAINAISNVKTSSVRYNLNGQAVGEDYKGIVIVNGKKMFNK